MPYPLTIKLMMINFKLKTTRWKNLPIQTYRLIMMLPILSLSNLHSLTQTPELSLHNSRPPILFQLFLHTFIVLFLLLHFLFFQTSWIASMFTSVSSSFDLQTHQLVFWSLWIESMPHPQFQQKVNPGQYPHISILCCRC